MANYYLFTHSILLLCLSHFTTTTTLAQALIARAPAPDGPTNCTEILDKNGQFKTLIHLLKTTQVGDQINTQLNNSNQGITILAPTDNAFSALKPGTLNSLNDQQKVQLLLFHIIPAFLSISQFQTVSNPLRTQAGNNNNGQFPLNVTSFGNQVNVSTGVNEARLGITNFSDDHLVVYQLDTVLLPLAMFGPQPPEGAPAPENGKNKTSSANSKNKTSSANSPSSDDGSADDSGALGFTSKLFLAGIAMIMATFHL